MQARKMAKKIKKYRFTPSHEKFCQHYAEYGNCTQAYLHAYPKVKYNSAKTLGAELLTIIDILDRIEQIKEEFAVSIQQSKERTVEALISSAEEAKIAGQFSAYAKLRDMVIKMCGFYEPEKSEIELKGITLNYISPDKKK